MAAAQNEARFLLRVFRSLPQTRRRLTASVLLKVVGARMHDAAFQSTLTALLDSANDAMDVEVAADNGTDAAAPAAELPASLQKFTPSAETDQYVGLLTTLFLLDSKRGAQVRTLPLCFGLKLTCGKGL